MVELDHQDPRQRPGPVGSRSRSCPTTLLSFEFGNDWWKLLAVALVFALVNSYIKPIVKALSFPISMMTLGLVAFVINAVMLLVVALLVRPAEARIQGRRLPAGPRTADAIVGALSGAVDHQHRLDPRQHRPDAAQAPVGRGRGSGDGTQEGWSRSARSRARSIAARDRGALRRAAIRPGTPAYVTDAATLDAAGAELRAAFPDPWIRQYSVKANDVPAIIARGRSERGRRRRQRRVARRVGARPPRRAPERGDHARGDRQVRRGPAGGGRGRPPTASRCAGSPSNREAEVEALAALARRAGLGRDGRPPVDVLFRLNPDVAPETHAGLAVGRGRLEVRDDRGRAGGRARRRRGTPDGALRPRGIHLHVGSQLGAIDAWRDAVRRALATLALLRGNEPDFDTLDVGGGFPVGPIGEPSPRPARFARELPALLEAIPADRRPTRLAIEPGRFLVARAGWLVARVLHVRERGGRQVVLDAGMTELIRPALYGARHADRGPDVARAAGRRARRRRRRAGADVHGPICESTDALGEHPLPPLRRGDLVAIRDAGAYARVAVVDLQRPAPPAPGPARPRRRALRSSGAAGRSTSLG